MTAEPVSLAALLAGHGRASTAVRPDDDENHADGAPADVVRLIVAAGERMDRHGWVRATAGNISVRLPDGRIAITRSGCHKGLLDDADVMLVDANGGALTDDRPSAETLLHCQIYRAVPTAGAVLHGHSVAATVLSLARRDDFRLSDYEVLKAFEGQRSHSATIVLPVFDNDQDIARLAAAIAPRLAGGMPAGYVIRGHGVYAWGPDMPTATVRLEALEFLLQCELERARLS